MMKASLLFLSALQGGNSFGLYESRLCIILVKHESYACINEVASGCNEEGKIYMIINTSYELIERETINHLRIYPGKHYITTYQTVLSVFRDCIIFSLSASAPWDEG